MTYPIDEKADQQAAFRALGDAIDAKTYIVAVGTANTAYSTAQMTPGAYRMWMPSGLPSDVLVVKRSATASTPAVTSPDADGEAVFAFPADAREIFRVTAAEAFLWLKTLTGTGTVYLSRLGP